MNHNKLEYFVIIVSPNFLLDKWEGNQCLSRFNELWRECHRYSHSQEPQREPGKKNWKHLRGGCKSHLPESSSWFFFLKTENTWEEALKVTFQSLLAGLFNSWGSTSKKVMYKNVPPAIPWVEFAVSFSQLGIYKASLDLWIRENISWSQFNTWRTPLHISWGREGGRSERAMPRFRKR